MDASRRYIPHFNLIADPFGDLADRRFIWLGEKQLENIAKLKVGVEQNKGVLLLVGKEGSGKSVLTDCLMRVLPAHLKTAVVREPGIDVARFFGILSHEFGLASENATKGVFLFLFKEFLKKTHSAGAPVLLILESAGAQSDEVLEQARLLSNIEEDGEKLLSLLLIGDEGLEETLSKPQHRALLQRVAAKCRVDALSEAETDAYIRHRMMVAGGFLRVFKQDSVKLVHRYSGGLPRLINLICEHALMHACREGQRSIDAKLVKRYAEGVLDRVGTASRPGPASLRRSAAAEWGGRSKKAGTMLRLAVLLVALSCLVLFAGFAREVLNRAPESAGPKAGSELPVTQSR